ncbi:MAG TPA: hypothetical protein VGX71_21325 [Pseudaminobacter sp.]|nr:hypothetical protein [Pseudaminobacter sp.]
MHSLPDPTQGELCGKGVETPSAMQAKFAVCEGCGVGFKPNRADQRSCSAACRARAHRQRPKKRALSAAVPKAVARSLTPCKKPGYPPGLTEARDSDGLPAFFSDQGDRLLRVWQGTVALSTVELRVMRLEPTGLAFPNGGLFREVAR